MTKDRHGPFLKLEKRLLPFSFVHFITAVVHLLWFLIKGLLDLGAQLNNNLIIPDSDRYGSNQPTLLNFFSCRYLDLKTRYTGKRGIQ